MSIASPIHKWRVSRKLGANSKWSGGWPESWFRVVHWGSLDGARAGRGVRGGGPRGPPELIEKFSKFEKLSKKGIFSYFQYRMYFGGFLELSFRKNLPDFFLFSYFLKSFLFRNFIKSDRNSKIRFAVDIPRYM